MTRLEEAVGYTRLGWRVFPIDRESKRPLTVHGFLDASSDPAEVAECWTAVPDANIGLWLAASNLIAIDVDPRNGGDEQFDELEEALGVLPRALVASTPSGGFHIFMRPVEGRRPRGKARRHGEALRGVDVKFNGYCLVEGSEKLDETGAVVGRYEWTDFAIDDVPAVPDAWVDVLYHPAIADYETPDGLAMLGLDGWSTTVDGPLQELEVASLEQRMRELGERGAGGSTTFRAFSTIFHDFGLSVDDGWEHLVVWNAASNKPHSEAELIRQLHRVASREHPGSRGRSRLGRGEKSALGRMVSRAQVWKDHLPEPEPEDDEPAPTAPREAIDVDAALAPPPEAAPIDQATLVAHYRATMTRLSRSTNTRARRDHDVLSRVLRPGATIARGDQSLAEALDDAAVALVRHAPEGAHVEQVAAMLQARPEDSQAAVERAAAVVGAELEAAGGRAPDDLDPPEIGEHDESDLLADEYDFRDAALALAWTNRRYAWIEELGRVARVDEPGAKLVSAETLLTTLKNRRVTLGIGADGNPVRKLLAALWFESRHRRSYRRIGLHAPPKVAPPGTLNLWRGFATAPKAGTWDLMRAHIADVVADGNEELDAYLIRWIAWLVQNPGRPAEAVVALRGGEGVGKGVVGKTIKDWFGPHAIHVTSQDHFVTGRFNGHMREAVFFFADECLWSGDKKHAGKLKGLITEPTFLVEQKGVDPFEVENQLHILISSNEDWIVPASADARRFVVLDVSNKRQRDAAYFDALHAELAAGGSAAMLRDLLDLDLGRWHPRMVVDSAGLRAQKERSLDSAEAWVLHLVEHGDLPRAIGNRGPAGWASCVALREHAQAVAPRTRELGDRALFAPLRALGALPRTTGNARGWQFPTLAEARTAWCAARWPREWEPRTDWNADDPIA